MSREDWLWDRTDPPDPEVAELERMLGRFAHDGRPLARRGGHGWRWIAAAAVVLALGGAVWSVLRDGEGLELRAGQRRLAAGEWFTSTANDDHLQLGSVVALRLEPGSRLQVRRVAEDETRLFLERGLLHATVAPTAGPRFLHVETPSARCVDLGCEFELRVGDDGGTDVAVLDGRVALERGEHSVYVPGGAECSAHPERGLGTPRFSDGDPTLAFVLDRFDRETDADRRVDFAEKLASVAARPRDTLVLWHLLRDADSRVAKAAERRLVGIAGWPPQLDPDARIAAWREHLEPNW